MVRKSLGLFVLFVVFVGTGFVAWDVYTPNEISWETASLNDHTIKKAPRLIVQHQDRDTVWATIGYSIYRSQNGEAFTKIVTVKPRLGWAWLGYLKSLRSWTGHVELTEVVPLSADLLVVFAGGDIYRVELSTKTQQHVHRLRYFGLGKGRGVLPHGITVDADNSIYFGEYHTMENYYDHDTRIYRSDDEGRTWNVAFEFSPGEIRHIHTVRWDPIGKAIWVGTGDSADHARIGYSYDGGKTFQWIGGGSKLFCVVSMQFHKDSMMWVTDSAETEYMRTMSWDRKEQQVQMGKQAPAAAFYALGLGDDYGIVTLEDASVWSIDSEHQFYKLLEWPTQYGKERRGPQSTVRVPRGQVAGLNSTYLSPLRTNREDAAIYQVPLSVLRPRVKEDVYNP